MTEKSLVSLRDRVRCKLWLQVIDRLRPDVAYEVSSRTSDAVYDRVSSPVSEQLPDELRRQTDSVCLPSRKQNT